MGPKISGDYNGGDIQNGIIRNVGAATACDAYCCARSDCNLYSYGPENSGTCYLKGTQGPLDTSKSNNLSAVKTRAPAPAAQFTEWPKTVGVYASGLAGYPGGDSFTTQAAAQAACAAHATCRAITGNNTNTNFSLRSGTTGVPSPTQETTWFKPA
jgi:hypothetical protein